MYYFIRYCLFTLFAIFSSTTALFSQRFNPPPDKPSEYLAYQLQGPIHVLEDDYVIVEAEDLPYSSNWTGPHVAVSEDDSEYTGDGFIRWIGPDTQGGNRLEDHQQEWQGLKQDWLVVKIWVEKSGDYEMDVRNFHPLEDGDNDIWSSYVPSDTVVHRSIGAHPKVYGWLNYNKLRFIMREGLNAVYVYGRSPGFGVDRIVIYDIGNEAAKEAALDPSTPTTQQFQSREDDTILNLDPNLAPWQNEGVVETWLGSVYYAQDLYPWFWHETHGWQYGLEGEIGRAWLYDPQLGYLYAVLPPYPSWYRPTLHSLVRNYRPYFYSADREAWLYYYTDTKSPRWFYDFGTDEYFSAPTSGN